MINEISALLIVSVIFIFLYFLLSRVFLQKLSVAVRGKPFEIQSPTTMDLSSSDGRWSAMMSILAVIISALISFTLLYAATELGLIYRQ